MKKTIMIFVLMILIFCLASCSAKPQDNKIDQINTDKTSQIKAAIAAFEKNVGGEVRETVVSSDGLVALLVESDSERRQKEYLQLYVYGKDPNDPFVPFFEPQVREGEVTAAEDGGFTVTCDSGTYFVGKDGSWTVRGKGTPFGAGPQDP
ncbi:MAG: hypothetical protein IKK29_07335 [Christensenellaceae bacterium]|nr:hypothetical protein [Christensenellaceae bacterium]